ncbi:MAG: hypothetical protein AUF79_03330 [Crenarchaeota archaeon 13_1_20CM_2_51_8]|nr:MAG: hypothetical protein AUF79_03330 [Crenarchaeota archaeon 13_1_20CM_2_51_8]
MDLSSAGSWSLQDPTCHYPGGRNRIMTEQTRSIRRLVLGIFSIALGIVSLVAFFSITYIAGVGFLGGFYGFILIALGVGLILPKREQKKEENR